jgi:hypothetical protein
MLCRDKLTQAPDWGATVNGARRSSIWIESLLFYFALLLFEALIYE